MTKVDVELLKQVNHIITHADCPDGIASAMILHDALPTARVTFLHYGSPELDALEAKPGQLWCDFSPPLERAQSFVDAGAIVLDHHKGAQEVVAMFGERGVFADELNEPGVSGAVLAVREVLRHLEPDDHRYAVANTFAHLVGVRDTWQTDDPCWRDACAQAEALTFYGFERLRNTLREAVALLPEEFEVGYLLLEKKLAAAQSIAERCTIVGRVAFFNERYASDTAEALRTRRPDVVLAVGFAYVGQSDRSMTLVYSLRAHGEVDCAALAKANGGGGHTNAAGFQFAYHCDEHALQGATDGDPIQRFIFAARKAGMARLLERS